MRGIKFISLHEKSGYGVAGYRYLQGLINSGIPVTWTPMVKGDEWGMEYQPFRNSDPGITFFSTVCNIEIEYDLVIVHTVPEYFPEWKRIEGDKIVVGCTVWETDKLPLQWLDLLNSVDALLVPCAWNKEVFQLHEIDPPVLIYPHICTNQTLPENFNYPEIRDEEFVFYTINTWTERKAISDTVKAYLRTFSYSDPVCLLIKTTEIDFTVSEFEKKVSDTISEIISRFPQPAKIILVTGDNLDDSQILNIHRRGDCYISLTRTEGWGMGAFDAATYEKPVIITGHGGHTDYLPKDLAYLVDYTLIPVEYHEKSFLYSRDQKWAQPDLSHAVDLMREIFENRKDLNDKKSKLKSFIVDKFNETTVTNNLFKDLHRVLKY
ncbi:glycosyltransferase [Microbulbifer epialgicus]|uniref:Glycosyltransferase n=1 Tax=Microbulbifer epialgicus TaxID=393907 RepID=A0ABV4P4D8_9GAMM